MIVTVTLNAAIDRTLTVPNFQLGQRHRASQGLTLVAARPLLAVARLGRPLTQTVTAPAVVALPVRAGAVLGRVEIRAGGKVVGTRDLVASRTINKPSLPRRLAWYAGRTLHHLGHLF